MIAAILSNRAQVEAFRSAHLLVPTRIYCDDERSYEELNRLEIDYQPLNEFQLRDVWSAVNAWGCQTACRWIALSKEGGFFKTIDFASVFYLFFSHLLVQGLKNHHYASHVVDDPAVSRVAVFNACDRKTFPEFSGNRFLNYFLKQEAERKGKEVLTFPCDPPLKTSGVASPVAVSIKKLVEKIYTFFVRPSEQPALWVYGSLMHLEALLLELKRKKVPFFYYSRELDFGQLKFSILNGFPYYIRTVFRENQAESSEFFIKEKTAEIRQALEHAAQRGLFNYQGIDLSDFVTTQIFGRIEETLGRLVPLMRDYESVLARVPVTGLLTDEDYALRGGFLAGYLQSRNVQTYCISHANTAVDFKIPEQDRVFGKSITFVQSAFERDNYAARGWQPNNFAISGTPRYDRLLQTQQKKSLRTGRKFRLLYCTNSSVTEKHGPDNYGYLGHAVYSTESVTRPAADAIFEAIKGLSVELWLKPHNLENIVEWENYAANSGVANQVKFLRRKTTILSYFADCDAMILSYWSSALIEAALARMPVIFIDRNNLGRPSLVAYASKGFCRIVNNAGQLRAEIETHCQACFGTARQNSRDVEYFLGERDGHASSRITDFLADQLKGIANGKKTF